MMPVVVTALAALSFFAAALPCADARLNPADAMKNTVTASAAGGFPGGRKPLGEFLFINDLSASMHDNMPRVKELVPELLKQLASTFPGSRFGMASFVDKPLTPFGYRGDEDCYRTQIPMTKHLSLVTEYIPKLQEGGGQDRPESQLDALFHGVKTRGIEWSKVKFDRDGIPVLRVVILATDAPYHRPGDGHAHHGLKPHPGDAEPNCAGFDYPSETQVRDAFNELNIRPLFLVAGSDVRADYETLLTYFNTGSVHSLTDDASSIVDALVTSLKEEATPTPPNDEPMQESDSPMDEPASLNIAPMKQDFPPTVTEATAATATTATATAMTSATGTTATAVTTKATAFLAHKTSTTSSSTTEGSSGTNVALLGALAGGAVLAALAGGGVMAYNSMPAADQELGEVDEGDDDEEPDDLFELEQGERR